MNPHPQTPKNAIFGQKREVLAAENKVRHQSGALNPAGRAGSVERAWSVKRARLADQAWLADESMRGGVE